VSYIINNVECTGCDFFEVEVMYKRAEGPPICPECGGERKMSFKGFTFAIHGQGYGSFTPVDFGVLGKAETKEDYDQCIATIEKRFPGKRVEVSHESATEKSTRLDELRHRSFVQRKSHGIDENMRKGIAEHQKQQAKKHLAAGNTKGKVTSAADLAKGIE
jgi:hypothetical protein